MYISLAGFRGPDHAGLDHAGPDHADSSPGPAHAGPDHADSGPRSGRTVAFRVAPTVIALGMVSLLTDVSSESVAAVLPLYVTGALGLSMVAYGFLEGLHQGVSAVVRIAAGYAADRTDQPKAIAVAGYGLSMLTRAGLLIVQGFVGIAVLVGIDRVGKGIRTAPRDAMIQEVSQPDHLARSFGVHRMLDTIGATIGPLLAFVVLLLVPEGYRVVFAVSLAAALIGVAALILFVPNVRFSRTTTSTTTPAAETSPVARPRTLRSRAPRSHSPRRPRWRTLDGSLKRLLVAAGVLGLLTVGDGFIYLAIMSHGHLDPLWFPLLFVGTNGVFLLLAIPVGRIADRTSRAAVLIGGHLFLAGAYLAAAMGGSWIALGLALLMLGIFYAATDGVLAALAGQLSPQGRTATGIGAAQTVVAITRLVASTGFGALWVLFGAVPTMVGAAVVLVLVLPLAWWLVVRR
ncbi:MFS transporter [Citricoccus nitrophenolicus]|uniref:MFS transporter n=1 Tax=Citricoccus muralis TaxID=169134 RepID=A0A3D9LB27_9MICC|nr:MFS transporter [Citricoccus muralis]REE02413.1 MFS transporter [Citricoccus muralis]